MNISRITAAMMLAAALALAACGGDAARDADTPRPATSAPSDGRLEPAAGGKIIEVDMLTDAEGNNIFEPADFEANTGDVIRFKLVSGVHNAHFLPDSNPSVRNYPPAGPLLQLPGQVYDVKVDFGAGSHFYQCDPHALLGMVGYVTVR
jgi:plastocyanin